MAQIKEYVNTKNVNPAPEENTAYSLERYGRIAQESIQQGAAGIESAAKGIQAHIDRQNISDIAATAATQKTEFETSQADWLLNHNNEYDPTDPDKVYRDRLDVIDQQNDKLKALATTQAGQDWVDRFAADRKVAETKSIYSQKVIDETARAQDNFNHVVTSNAQIAAQSPEQAQDLIAQTKFMAEGILPSTVHKDAIDQASSHIADAAATGAYAQLAKKDPALLAPGDIDAAIAHVGDLPTSEVGARVIAQLTELKNGLPEAQERAKNARQIEQDRVNREQYHTAVAQFDQQFTNPNTGEKLYSPSYFQGLQQLKGMPGVDLEQINAYERAGVAAMNKGDKLEETSEQIATFNKLLNGGSINQVWVAAGRNQISARQMDILERKYKVLTDASKDQTFGPLVTKQLTDYENEAKLAFSILGNNGTPESMKALTGFDQYLYGQMEKLSKDQRGPWLIKNADDIRAAMQKFIPASPEPTNPNTSPAAAVLPTKKGNVSALGLDKFPRGTPGSKNGMDALHAAVKGGKITPDQALSEATTRGWYTPEAQ